MTEATENTLQPGKIKTHASLLLNVQKYQSKLSL